MNTQPYTLLDIQTLINLEGGLREFSRINYEHSISYHIGRKSKNVYVMPTDLNSVIILWKLLDQKVEDLTMAKQIVGHWLLGQRAKSETFHIRTRNDRIIDEEEVKLFCQGGQVSLKKYRDNNEVSAEINPTCEWKLLHYPFEIVKSIMQVESVNEIVEDLRDLSVDGNAVLMMAYGIVSKQHHKRTDKRKILETVKSFLMKKGFEDGVALEGKDWTRSGEPVVVWVSKNKHDGVDYRGAVGINFGYDNGLSGYRYAVGIYLSKDDITLSHMPRNIFAKQMNDEGFKGVVDAAYASWIHLSVYGSLEIKFKEFLDRYYLRLLEGMSRQFEMAKMKKYTVSQSIKLIHHTHSAEFKEFRETLTGLHDVNLHVHGPTAFNHFVTWLQLAKQMDGDRYKRSRAEFVAACILGNA